MASTVVQAGASLKLVNEAGGVTDLVLPTGVTLRTDVPPRWCTNNNYLILVNTPSQPLIIDAKGIVRLLTPKAPRLAPVLSGVAGGTLTGTYGGVRYTFVTVDENFNIISESDYSPGSNTVSLTGQFLRAASLDISPDQISMRRIYRPTNNGVVLFQWVDLDGNVQTSIQDDLSDAGLVTQSGPILGTPPRLTHIAEFRGRLFGVGDLAIDTLRYTEAGLQYAWPSDNVIQIGLVGSDIFGVTGLIPRREALGVGRRNMLVQITGSGAEDGTGNIDFDNVILSRELGIESQETVKVYRDTAFFLWKDGVYMWGSEGIRCISDGLPTGKGQVRSWFVTDDFFNRDKFSIAFAHIDPNDPIYRLFLASADSDIVDSWVEYDINAGTWWGPHRTDAFVPFSAFNRMNEADRSFPIIGGAATMYQEQETRTDGDSTPIEMDALGKAHDMDEPDIEKYWGEVSVLGEGGQTNGVLQVTATFGDLDSATFNPQGKALYHQLNKTRERLGRIGRGKHAQLRMTNAQVGQDVVIYGYEIDPVNIVGRR